ncbi:MAG: ATP-NAD kinase family protein [Acidilobus sp.]
MELPKLGLIVNPIAGMGGRVGLKGTDGEAYRLALSMGARPVAPARAVEFLRALTMRARILTPPGVMGEAEAREAGRGEEIEVLRCAPASGETGAEDTRRCASMMVGRVPLLVFVGGDGTARDVLSAIDERLVILGVPSGVKMYSGVFAETPALAAVTAERFLRGEVNATRAEVLDVDEEAFRRGELRVSAYGTALVPSSQEVVTAGKEAGGWDEDELEAVADYVVELMEPGVLYLLGPGTTVAAVARRLGVPKTVLGVDAVVDGRPVGHDLSEVQILRLLDEYPRAKIIVSPIGGQGFIFGRGNQQLSPEVIRRVGVDNVVVVATRSKANRLRSLRVDTGDHDLDRLIRGYRRVIVGYGEELVLKVE